jgi:hypothetical protein
MYTVAEAVPLRPCAEAVIVAVPNPCPVATPLAGSIDTTLGESLDHDTPLLIWDRVLSA